MINTLRTNNDSFAKLANVSVQPATASSNQFLIQQQTSAVNVKTPLPASQAMLSSPVLLKSNDLSSVSTLKVSRPSLGRLSDSISSNKVSLIMPMYNGNVRLMPTHALSLDAGQVFDPRINQTFATTTTKFQPFEQLTGIAHERPEIVMLTNVVPLFDNESNFVSVQSDSAITDYAMNPYMTDAGRYCDSQIQMRNLTSWNMQSSVSSIRRRYPGLNQQFVNRSNDFMQSLTQLKGHSSFLLNLVRILDAQKKQLDLRHGLYVVNPQEVAQYVEQRYSQNNSSARLSTLNRINLSSISDGMRSTFDCVDSLTDVGYSVDAVKHIFSSTKIWLQLLSELKSMLKNHSLKLIDIDPIRQRGDNNPTVLLPPATNYFSLSKNLPQLPSLTELINLEVANSSKTLNLLSPVFVSMYQNVFFKNEEARLAALAHTLTQEFRYSVGLSKTAVVTSLQNFYGYNVTLNGNTTMLDAVFGNFGNNITDFPATQDKSLASIAQNSIGLNQEEGLGILTFETKYVEGDTGTLTPGGEFFIDRVLNTEGDKFNTTTLDQLVVQMDDQLKQLNIIIDGLNLFSTPSMPNAELNGASRKQNSGFLTTSYDTINEVASKLINIRTGAPQRVSTDDKLSAIYTKARTDNNIKTMLFLYTLSKISRNYNKNVPFFASREKADNTPLVDDLIEKIVAAAATSASDNRATLQLVVQKAASNMNAAAATRDNIKHALKTGTEMSTIVEQFMSSVIAQFRLNTTAIQDEFTRYGGYLDTVVMMLAFDFVIAMIAKYSNQTLVGSHSSVSSLSKGMDVFAINAMSTNHNTSYKQLLQRVSSEAKTSQQLLLTVINSLRNLSGSLRGVSSYLNSSDSKTKLKQIADVLQNNKDMIRMLISEQQIMMLASTIESLEAASKTSSSSSDDNGSYHEGSANADAIVVLDESVVPPNAKEALYGLFGAPQFASKRGSNNRILTVGIPLGFCQRLKQKVDIKSQTSSAFANKQADIVRISVYKVDLQNSDIVYKPQQFLFELSRFPVRPNTALWLSLPARPSLNDVVYAIPTHNFGNDPTTTSGGTYSSAGIEYASTNLTSKAGVRGARQAFNESSYDFLSSTEKSEILKNHVTSQLLEIYIKLMTGINVAEYNYDMSEVPDTIENDFVKTLAEHSMQLIVDQSSNHAGTFKPSVNPPSGGILFSSTSSASKRPGVANISKVSLSNAAGVAGSVNAASVFKSMSSAAAVTRSIEFQTPAQGLGAKLSLLSPRNTMLAYDGFRPAAGMAKTLTTASSVLALERRVMTPKAFDRVFNVVVDPHNFELDVEKTISTPYGRQALELLINHGDIVPSDLSSSSKLRASMMSSGQKQTSVNSGQPESNINNFRYRDRDKNQGDLISDKYFITIETYGQEEV